MSAKSHLTAGPRVRAVSLCNLRSISQKDYCHFASPSADRQPQDLSEGSQEEKEAGAQSKKAPAESQWWSHFLGPRKSVPQGRLWGEANGQEHEPGLDLIPALPLTSCVLPDKFLKVSVPQFPHL